MADPKKMLDDVIQQCLKDDAKEAVLDLLSFLRESKMRTVETSYHTWRVNYKGEICVVQISFPGDKTPWAVTLRLNHIQEYADLIQREGLEHVIMDNLVYCVFGEGQSGIGCSPNKPCALGENRIILSREINGICSSSTSKFIRIWNPTRTAVKGIKRLLALEQKLRSEQKESVEKADKSNIPKQKDERLKIEDAAQFVQGERLQNLLNFSSWLKACKLPPTWVRTTVSSYSKIWKVKNICSIKVKYDGLHMGSWIVGFGMDDKELTLNAQLKELVRTNANVCKHCEGGCLPQGIRKVCGVEVERLCCFALEFWNPDKETIHEIQQLLNEIK